MWQQVVAAAIVFNCCLTFFLLAFISIWHLLWVAASLCDLLMMSNVIVMFFVVFIDDRGVEYDTCKVVARKYLLSMFIWDVLSVLPLDYFLVGALLSYPNERAWLRLNRLLGLIRVNKQVSECPQSAVMCLCVCSRLTGRRPELASALTFISQLVIISVIQTN